LLVCKASLKHELHQRTPPVSRTKSAAVRLQINHPSDSGTPDTENLFPVRKRISMYDSLSAAKKIRSLHGVVPSRIFDP